MADASLADPPAAAPDSDAPDEGDDGSQSGDKNALEWAVTGAGALVVLFVVGFFAYELVAGASGPADLVVRLGPPSPNGATVEVPVEVRNTGERVAEQAVVEVCAGPDNCAEVTFEYVPYQSRQTGTVGLVAPLAEAPTSRVVSYRDP